MGGFVHAHSSSRCVVRVASGWSKKTDNVRPHKISLGFCVLVFSSAKVPTWIIAASLPMTPPAAPARREVEPQAVGAGARTLAARVVWPL